MSNLISDALKALTNEIKAKFNVEQAAFIVVTTTEGVDLILGGDLVVGVPVTVKDAEGVESPAMDGEYVLTDGTSITIASGMISEIETAAEPVAPTEELNTELSSQLEGINQLISMVADKFEALTKRVDELEVKEITGFAKSEEVSDLKNTFLKLLPILESLSTENVAEPITVKKNEFKKEDIKNNKLRDLAETLSRIKK